MKQPTLKQLLKARKSMDIVLIEIQYMATYEEFKRRAEQEILVAQSPEATHLLVSSYLDVVEKLSHLTTFAEKIKLMKTHLVVLREVQDQ